MKRQRGSVVEYGVLYANSISPRSLAHAYLTVGGHLVCVLSLCVCVYVCVCVCVCLRVLACVCLLPGSAEYRSSPGRWPVRHTVAGLSAAAPVPWSGVWPAGAGRPAGAAPAAGRSDWC